MSAFDDDNDCVFTRGERAWSASDVAWRVTHVLPLEDVVAHELGTECVCGPWVEAVGDVPWEMVKHHVLVK
jgi:hypothetical protein